MQNNNNNHNTADVFILLFEQKGLDMEAFGLYAALSLLLFQFSIHFLSKRLQNLPPSPALTLPIIGHLHLIKTPLHRSLYNLSQKYGKIFSLQMGNRLLVVVSSPSAVEECFTKNDTMLSDRPRSIIAEYVTYNFSTMAGLPYGDRWRNLRKLAATEIFSPTRLNAFWYIRKDEVRRLVLELSEESMYGFAKVEIRSRLAALTFNVVMRMMSGKRHFGPDEKNDEAKTFQGLIKEIVAHTVGAYPADYLPFLRWVGYGNYEKGLASTIQKMDTYLEGLLEEHRQMKKNTMIDHLLSLQHSSEAEYFDDNSIKGLVLVSALLLCSAIFFIRLNTLCPICFRV